MSCCGQKRQEWMKEVKNSVQRETIENVSGQEIEDKPEKVFEYIGNYSMSIKGAATGNLYKFQFKGDKLNVDYFDSFALMAESDLKILPIGQKEERI